MRIEFLIVAPLSSAPVMTIWIPPGITDKSGALVSESDAHSIVSPLA
jgi:hypothetical protein